MGWTKIHTTRGLKKPDAVKIGLRLGPTLSVIVGTDVAAKLAWKDELMVDVLYGDGDDAGWIRVQPSEQGRKLTRKTDDAPFSLQIRGLPRDWRTSEPFKPRECSIKLEDGILDVELPESLLPSTGFEDDPKAVKQPAGKRIGPAGATRELRRAG